MKHLVLLLLCLLFPVAANSADIQVHRDALPNGLQLQVVTRTALPIVSVSLALPAAGAREDAPSQAGSADLVATLLTEGTTTRSAADIAEAIEFVGGSLGAGVRRDYATLSLTVLSRDLELGMTLLADVVRNPGFPAAEVDRVVKESISYIKASEDQPGAVVARAFDNALFGDHPYGRPVEGTIDTVSALSRDDLITFHRHHYVPDGAVLSMVGNVTPKAARKLAKRLFGSWSGVAPKAAGSASPKALSKTRLVTVDRELTQANVAMGHVGVARTDPDFYPLVVMNYILGGGGFTSRLVKSVRDRQGLAYSIHSGFTALREPGPFAVRFQTQNGNAQQAIDSVLVELKKIRTNPVTETELDEAKSYLAGSFPLRLDTNRKTAGLLTFVAMNHLGTTYFDDYLARVEAVTRADIERVANTYLHPDNMLWVVVANQQEANVGTP